MVNYHSTYNDNKKQWELKKEGNTRPSKVSKTKDNIIKESSDFLKKKGGSNKIHNKNGKTI